MKTQEDFNIAGVYTYEDLLKAMQRGWKFCEVTTYYDGTKNLHTVCSADAHLIRWNHYGSSANEATAKGMQFVIEKIFSMTLPEFIRAFVWVL